MPDDDTRPRVDDRVGHFLHHGHLIGGYPKGAVGP